MQGKIKFLVEEPIKITLLWVATDLIKYLSIDTQELVYEKTIESANYIIEHFYNFPHGKFFEYNTPIGGELEYGYVAFWDRRENNDFVVITSFSFHRACDRKIPDDKIEMINGFIVDYFKITE